MQTPPANFNRFPVALLTVFQVRANILIHSNDQFSNTVKFLLSKLKQISIRVAS